MTTSFRQVTASEAEDRAGPGLRYGRASPGPGPILHGRFSTTPLDVTPDPAEIGPKQPSLRYIFAALLEAPRVVAAPVGGRHTGGI